MLYDEISPQEAAAKLPLFRVLDVREEHEFHGPLGSLEDAELVPLSKIEAHAKALTDGGPLLMVCRSGKRSGIACQKLCEQGLDGVTNLSGGMIGWNREGLPVRRTEPETLLGLVEQVVAWAGQFGPLTPEQTRTAARDHFEQNDVPFESPLRAAVSGLIDFMAESVATADSPPPDLDICLASFRRSLAAL